MVTALHSFSVQEYRDLVDSLEVPGGALAALGDGLLLVTGEGEFYKLAWSDAGVLTSRRLALRAPLKQGWPGPEPERSRNAREGWYLRTLDIAVDQSESPTRIYLSHQYWDPVSLCFTVRVSSINLATGAEPGQHGRPWETLFETAPCIPTSYELRRGGLGSRLAWEAPHVLLVSIGDHGLSGPDGLTGPQDPQSPYGKILRLDTSGRHAVFTLGHRNPQGLSVGPDGRAWSSEHGPQGGDEINFLESGGNYGHPLASYGVQYGQTNWPLAAGRRDHAGFHEPAFAFVPSVAPSNLIHLGPKGFRNWEGDLLLSTLRDRSLYRLHTSRDRIAYAERIPIGYRIRDLEQSADGRIVLWTDKAELVVLTSLPALTRGEQAYPGCAGCHGVNLEGSDAGPSLLGVVGREVASEQGFAYSAGLKRIGGRWTPERLERFFRHPQAFAPGSSMYFPGVSDSISFLLIEYLRSHQHASVESAAPWDGATSNASLRPHG